MAAARDARLWHRIEKGGKRAGERGSSTLLSTFQGLQEKLAEAKKQFRVEEAAQENSSNFELNSFKASSSASGRWAGESILEKLEESTINLESQKRLISAVQSKERIVWAQRVKTYYLTEAVKAIAGVNERALEHLTISLEILRSCASLSLPPLAHRAALLPGLPPGGPACTLVVDLDETLFHCS